MTDEHEKTGLEIAVIGMAGRFPGAKNINEFWNNLKNGVESISFLTGEELEELGIADNILNDPNYVPVKGGVLDNTEYFDSSFFGYLPVEAQVMDPQIRLFHECAWEALEDAGYDPDGCEGLIGIYGGASDHLYWEALTFMTTSESMLDSFTTSQLSDKDFLTAHVSFKLNLKGPAITLQTACSTSLVAVDQACRGLLSGSCDIALAGGVTVNTKEKAGILYREGTILSRDGHCRAFDKEATGTVFGEGVGIVVLKRLEEAIGDGDHIYCMVKGFAINNDGIRKAGFTAPSIEGQAEVIRSAQQMADVQFESIGYVETHGTGTPLGDPVEVEALKVAFNTKKRQYCGIGSVKTNVGHLDAAAGITGLIKTILALMHRQLPPSLHFKKPNPEIDFENSPFYVVSQLKDWENSSNPLRASVNSLGIGGTNAHIILEETPQSVIGHRSSIIGKEGNFQLILLSAKTHSALEKMTVNLEDYFKGTPDVNLADVAYTLQVGRRDFNNRKMLVCSTVDEGIAALSTDDPQKIKTSLVREDNRYIVFMFSGQGAQYVNMGLQLYQKQSLFRQEMDRCLEILNGLMDYDIKEGE
jgi:acyl transferase domain-containing protein